VEPSEWISVSSRTVCICCWIISVGSATVETAEGSRYRLPELLFLGTCATIAGCGAFGEIGDWGAAHLSFPREHDKYFFGSPKKIWLRVVLNRIDPALFRPASRPRGLSCFLCLGP
jgi:hypothetical protein